MRQGGGGTEDPPLPQAAGPQARRVLAEVHRMEALT